MACKEEGLYGIGHVDVTTTVGLVKPLFSILILISHYKSLFKMIFPQFAYTIESVVNCYVVF